MAEPVSLTAFLANVAMPKQFSYDNFVAVKRYVPVPTHGGMRIHTPVSPIISGDITFNFRIPGASSSDFALINSIYLAAGTVGTVLFVGYWGDAATVRFLELSNPPVRQHFFDITGQLRLV